MFARHDDPDERRGSGAPEHRDPGQPTDAGLRPGAGCRRRPGLGAPHGVVSPRINRHSCVSRGAWLRARLGVEPEEMVTKDERRAAKSGRSLKDMSHLRSVASMDR